MSYFSFKHATAVSLFVFTSVLYGAVSIDTGSHPSHAIIVGNTLYTANTDSNTVTSIDTRDNRVIHALGVGRGPSTLVATSRYIYVANTAGGTVTVINIASNTVYSEITVPQGVQHFLLYERYLYVFGPEYLTVINTYNNSIERTIKYQGGKIGENYNYSVSGRVYVHDESGKYLSYFRPGSPWMTNIDIGYGSIDSLVVNKTLYVINAKKNQITLHDAASHKALQKNGEPDIILVGREPRDIISVGTKLYITNSLDNTVSIIDTTTNTVTKTLPVGNKPIAMYLSGRSLFVLNNEGNTVSVVDTVVDTVVATLTTGISPSFAIVEGDNLYVINSQSNSVSVFDIGAPRLLEFNTAEAAGTYGQDKTLTIRASFDSEPLAGSTMSIMLNTNKTVILDTIQGKTLTGKYAIGAGENTERLTVKSLVSSDIKSDAEIPGVYTIPYNKNIGDLRAIVIKTTGSTTSGPVCKNTGLYRLCPIAKPLTNIWEHTASLLCEGIITYSQTQRYLKRVNRQDVLTMAVKMSRASIADTSYKGRFEDITDSMKPIIGAALNRGLITNAQFFQPTKSITRIEVYTLLMKSVCLAPDEKTSVNWTQSVHDVALKSGITTKPFSAFNPSEIITKKEAFVIASRIVDWADRTGGCRPQVCK